MDSVAAIRAGEHKTHGVQGQEKTGRGRQKKVFSKPGRMRENYIDFAPTCRKNAQNIALFI
jgi:hypothetical protein